MYTVTKAKRDTGLYNMWVTENSIIHIDRSEKSVINKGRAGQAKWMTGFSVPPHVSGLRHALLF
jgi:hypothetical protein